MSEDECKHAAGTEYLPIIGWTCRRCGEERPEPIIIPVETITAREAEARWPSP